MLTIKCSTQCHKVAFKRVVDSLALLSFRIKTCPGLVRVDGPADQKIALRLTVFNKRFKCPGTEFFRPRVIKHLHLRIRPLRTLKQRTGAGAILIQQDGLKTGAQSFVERMLLLVSAIQPTTGRESATPQAAERLMPHVMIESVKPFVGQASCPRILRKRQLSGCRDVVRGNARPARRSRTATPVIHATRSDVPGPGGYS